MFPKATLTLAVGVAYLLSQVSPSQAAPSKLQSLTYEPACANANSNNGIVNENDYFNCYYPEVWNDNCARLRDLLGDADNCDLTPYSPGNNARCVFVGEGTDSCTACSHIPQDLAACGTMYTLLDSLQDKCQGHLGSVCNEGGYESLSKSMHRISSIFWLLMIERRLIGLEYHSLSV